MTVWRGRGEQKELMNEIVRLWGEGISQKEISKRVGISRVYVSAFIIWREVLDEDIAREWARIEDEKRKVREEKEEHRQNVEEVTRIKRKISELKAKEEELRERVRRKRNEAHQIEEEVEGERKERDRLKEKRKRLEKELKDAEEYRERKEDLEREYRKLEIKRVVIETGVDQKRREKKKQEEEYERMMRGRLEDMIPFFHGLTARQKAYLFSFDMDEEIHEVIQELLNMVMTRRVVMTVMR